MPSPAVFTRKPFGYWNEAEGKNMRSLLEQYAKQSHCDPLVAENWYSFAHQLRYKKVKKHEELK